MKNLKLISAMCVLAFVMSCNKKAESQAGCCGASCCKMDKCEAMIDEKSTCGTKCCASDGCKKSDNACCKKS